MEMIKKKIVDYWQVVFTLAVVVFNVGYTVARLEDRPTKEEVVQIIDNNLKKFNDEASRNYIEVSKVAGLKESLNGLKQTIDETAQSVKEIQYFLLNGKTKAK